MMSPARKKPASAKTAKARTRPAPTADALPQLSAFLSGYLHQDFFHDYNSPAEALAGFLAECSPAERRALANDWRAFTAGVEGRTWRYVRQAFSNLGGAWLPPSRAALDVLFSTLD